MRQLLAAAGDAGLEPVALYTAVGRSRSWCWQLASRSAWIVRGADGRYRLREDE